MVVIQNCSKLIELGAGFMDICTDIVVKYQTFMESARISPRSFFASSYSESEYNLAK